MFLVCEEETEDDVVFPLERPILSFIYFNLNTNQSCYTGYIWQPLSHLITFIVMVFPVINITLS